MQKLLKNLSLFLDVDVKAVNITYINASIPIVRSTIKIYAFNITITSPIGSSTIPSTQDGNWRINYVLNSQTRENSDWLPSLYNSGLLQYANIPADVFMQILTPGTVVQLPVTISLSFNYSVCHADLYLCLLVTPSALAAWYDPNLANNVACLLLDPYKDCSPGELYN